MTVSSLASETLLDAMLAHLTVDWSYPSWIATDAGRVAANAEDRRTLALGVIASGVLAELVTIGALEDDGFEPMPGSKHENLIAIAQDWLSSPEPTGDTWDICWFAATDTGRKRGLSIVAARDADHPHEIEKGSCEFRQVRNALCKDEVSLREILDDIDSQPLLPQDQTALALGLLIEGFVTGQVRLVDSTDDLVSDVAMLYASLTQGENLRLRSLSQPS